MLFFNLTKTIITNNNNTVCANVAEVPIMTDGLFHFQPFSDMSFNTLHAILIGSNSDIAFNAGGWLSIGQIPPNEKVKPLNIHRLFTIKNKSL